MSHTRLRMFIDALNRINSSSVLVKEFTKIFEKEDEFKPLQEYNNMAEEILRGTSVKMWYSAKFIGENSFEDNVDPVHFSDYANYNFMQILLNMLCNSKMKLEMKFCCSENIST
ncbi:UNVERIFIED_CONTAM: hypothetical protein RMT77_005024 [Armadillidium vulgare]